MSGSAGPISIVSGAASGIGRHMAIALARLGHRLMLTDINHAGMQALVIEQGWQQRDDIVLHPLDVRDAQGWQRLVDDTVKRFGAVDHMLNIAGYLRAGHFVDLDVDSIDRHIDINVKGMMYATHAGARQMAKQEHGHILNVASIAAVSAVPGLAAYCASKHAVRGFSLSIAHELRKHKVAVTVFCPDAVETPMLKQQEAHPEAAMTFGAGRGLTLDEVERAILRALRDRPLEVLLDVPGSARGFSAKLANTFPRLTALGLKRIQAQGERTQQQRLKRATTP